MKINLTCLVMALLAIAGIALPASAQWPVGDVSLVSESGTQVTLKCIYSAPKAKEAFEDAQKAAFWSLLKRGVPDLHHGQPMIEGEAKSFVYRFFNEGIYLRALVGVPYKESDTKIQGQHRVTVQLTVNTDALRKFAKDGGAVISPAWTAGDAPAVTASVNPSVVVVPQVKGEAQDFEAMKTALENDPSLAYAVNEISNVFARQKYKTQDVRTVLADVKTSDFLNEDAQNDRQSMVLRQLPGDILVFVDLNITTNGNLSNCILTIDAVEKQTRVKLAGKAFNSGEFMTRNYNELVNHAIKKVRKDFFADMQAAFDRMVDEGRRMVIEFNLGQEVTDWDFDTPTPAGDHEFAEALEEFMAANSCKGRYEIESASDKFMRVSLNIPIWDEKKGKGYTTSNFVSALKKFLRAEVGDAYKPQVLSMGQKINVTFK